jgi:hypothetical protein
MGEGSTWSAGTVGSMEYNPQPRHQFERLALSHREQYRLPLLESVSKLERSRMLEIHQQLHKL